MNIELNSSSATKATLSINIEPSDYLELVEKKTKEYSKKIALKGFRPGKAPLSYVKKMYGNSIKYEEINQIISKNIVDYIENNKINLLRDPIPNTRLDTIDLEKDTHYKFDFDLFIVPSFNAPIEWKISSYEVVIDDETLEEKIVELQNNLSVNVDKEEVGEGDYISGDLKRKESEDAPYFTAVMYNKLSDEGKKVFLNTKKGETISFDIQSIFDNDKDSIRLFTGVTKEEVEEVKGLYEFTLKHISGRKPADLNEELFSRVFPGEEVKTVEEFKSRYKEILQNHSKSLAINEQKKELMAELMKNIAVEISHEYIEEVLKDKSNENTSKEEFINYLKEEKIIQRYFEELKPKFNEEEFYNFLLDVFSNRTGLGGNFYNLPDWAQKVVKDQVNKLYAKENKGTLNYYMFLFMKQLVLEELLNRQNAFNTKTISYSQLLEKSKEY